MSLRTVVGLLGCLGALSLAAPTQAAATFPGENGPLAIGCGNVCVVNPTTGDISPVTHRHTHHFQVWDYFPRFSPPGRFIIFERVFPSGRAAVWTVRTDGSRHAHELIHTGATPSFTADRRVLFTNRNGEIALADRDGSSRRSTHVRGFHAVMSPDGGQIAFTRLASNGNRRLWVMAADGTDPHPLTADGTAADWPSYAPDGGRIMIRYYGERVDPTHDIGIYTLQPDGSNLTQIRPMPPDDAYYEDWSVFSPDGTQIAFQHINWEFLDEGGCCSYLAVMSSDGTGLRHLFHAFVEAGDWGPAVP